MQIVTDPRAALAERQTRAGRRRVLLPTMGALHRGHLKLIERARAAAGPEGEVAVSIFVNPLQFEPGADLERYPRPTERDEELCRGAGVDLLFRPDGDEMYFIDRSIFVEEVSLSQTLCGARRPGHFRGVCTVVTKLFHLLAPDAAVFGEKDFQQLAIMRRLVRDLHFPIEIIAAPTVRESDGLALSSRNQYLSPEERAQAPVLYRALREAAAIGGEKNARTIVEQVQREISEQAPDSRIDYVELVDAETLQALGETKPDALLALAVFFGKTRLIDNIRWP